MRALLILLAMSMAISKKKPADNRVEIPATSASDRTHEPVLIDPPSPVLGDLKFVERDELVATLQSFVGVKEEPRGSNQGRMVNKFNASAGFQPSAKAPWCASVIHYAYSEVGGPDRPGAYCPSWAVTKRRISISDVQPGDTGLIYFSSKGRYAHAFTVERVNLVRGRPQSVTTLEGNTNAEGSREGDQFARRTRGIDNGFFRWWPR